MRRRSLPATLAVLMFGVVCGTNGAQTRYDYGGSGFGYGSDEAGFLVMIEAGVANPRNTDNIVAAVGPNVIIPQWDDDFAGRIGLGYQFASGSRAMVSFWGFETDQSSAGSGAFEFPVGPTDGIAFDVTTEIQARTIEASWAVSHEVSDAFDMEWSLGLRHASFEETTDGTYGTTGGQLAVAKSNEGNMIGARLGGRATYRRGSLSAGAGVGLSMLNGEIEAGAALTPQPGGTTALALSDDSRSGTILDVDVRGTWHGANDNLAVWIGWEQQDWRQIAADLARDLPGSAVVSRGRDSVTFSWVKVGASFRF